MTRTIGDWKLGDTIGQGGMGIVYRATHELIEGDFAVKMLRPELASEPGVVKRFLAEVQKARVLDHPNIVRMEIPFRDGKDIYLPMEFLRGRTMSELIEDEPGPWPLDRTLDQIRQAALGLGHAHSRQVLHRDVKPDNLFITNMGRVKLLDFGLAKRFGEKSITGRGMAVGTPVYMAPEVLRGNKPIAASDLYSLGVILFRLLTGKLPIPVQDTSATLAEIFGPVLHAHEQGLPRPASIQPGIPKWLDDLCGRLLDQDPTVRPNNGAELAQILEQHPVRPDGSTPLPEDLPQMLVPTVPAASNDRIPIPQIDASSGAIQVVNPSSDGAASLPPSYVGAVPPKNNGFMTAVIAIGASALSVGLYSIAQTKSDPPVVAPAQPSGIAVAFSSEPQGAFVMSGDRKICEATPCSARLSPGPHEVSMRLEQHVTYEAMVTVDDKTTGFHAKLSPKHALVSIATVPSGLDVWVDGQNWGASPLDNRKLQPGLHKFEVRDRRYRRTSKSVRMVAGDSQQVLLQTTTFKTKSPATKPPNSKDGQGGNPFEDPMFRDYDDDKGVASPGGGPPSGGL